MTLVTEKGFDQARGREPRMARARARLARSRASFLDLLGDDPSEECCRPRAQGGWTVVEILEHVARTERGVVQMLGTARRGRTGAGSSLEAPRCDDDLYQLWQTA